MCLVRQGGCAAWREARSRNPRHPQPPGVSAIAIATGDYHTCAIVAGGGVKCWGLNDYGQLGIGINTNQNSPVDVAGRQAFGVNCSSLSALIYH